MKITIISFSDSKGGAAIAAHRQALALKANGHEISLLVLDKSQEIASLIEPGIIGKIKAKLFFILERFLFLPNEKSKAVRFKFNLGYYGFDLSSQEAIKKADIIHFHWINFGTLSLQSIKKLFDLKKPIFHTLHDSWIFTGGCHLTGNCENFTKECGNCFYLKNPGENDLSHYHWKIKNQLFQHSRIQLIACSDWIKEKAKRSSIFKEKNIQTIGNPLDLNLFKPLKEKTSNIKTLLFISANIDDPKKGFEYLKQALSFIEKKNFRIIVIGKNADKITESTLACQVESIEFIEANKLINYYQKADILVYPSLEDNLPNTIMESMACGTPVVAFKTGGIPEMIDHQINGYLADYENPQDLAKGIQFLLEKDLSTFARKKIEENFDQNLIANQLVKIYQESIHE